MSITSSLRLMHASTDLAHRHEDCPVASEVERILWAMGQIGSTGYLDGAPEVVVWIVHKVRCDSALLVKPLL